MNKFIRISSTDHTDIIVFLDKIQYVSQSKKGCSIGLDNGCCINSDASFEDVSKAIEKLVK